MTQNSRYAKDFDLCVAGKGDFAIYYLVLGRNTSQPGQWHCMLYIGGKSMSSSDGVHLTGRISTNEDDYFHIVSEADVEI